MNPDYARVARAWLEKASSDLQAAKLLIDRESALPDVGVYHCQQSAEKALKGFLTSRGVIFRKSHDLQELLSQCGEIDEAFAHLAEAARFLAPFAVEYRYPGDMSQPPMEEALLALEYAAQITRFVSLSIGNAR